MRKGHSRSGNADQIDGFLQELWRLCKNGSLQKTLNLVYHLDQSGFAVSTKVFSCLLQACSLNKDLHTGRELHSWIMRSGFNNIFLANQLIRMFVSCGSLLEANQVFENSKPNVFSWTLIISAHANMGLHERAIALYSRMRDESSGHLKPDPYVFVASLKACTHLGSLAQGRLIHADIKQSGLESHVFVANTLINMYAKCECLQEAKALFGRLPERDVVTWGAIISAYVQNGQGEEAFKLFAQMRREGITPSGVTFMCILKACSGNMNLNQGKCIHMDIVECLSELDTSLGNMLVDMYVKCGSFDDAMAMFQTLTKRDKVAWNVMVDAFDQEGCGEEAFHMYEQMQEEGIDPDRVSFVSILKVCSRTAGLQQGRLIHGHIIDAGFESDAFICNTLIDMYVKCGTLADAYKLLVKSSTQDVAAWNAMISGGAQNSDFKLASQYLEDMTKKCIKGNTITDISFLSAYSHAGLIDGGTNHFNTLNESALHTYPDSHNCMVNLLGSTGKLEDAEHLLQTMPNGSNSVGWRSLFSHCKIHGSLKYGQHCFDPQKFDIEAAKDYKSNYP